jgi:hypothetical protein
VSNQYSDTYNDQNTCDIGEHGQFSRGTQIRVRESLHSQNEFAESSRNVGTLMIFSNNGGHSNSPTQ